MKTQGRRKSSSIEAARFVRVKDENGEILSVPVNQGKQSRLKKSEPQEKTSRLPEIQKTSGSQEKKVRSITNKGYIKRRAEWATRDTKGVMRSSIYLGMLLSDDKRKTPRRR